MPSLPNVLESLQNLTEPTIHKSDPDTQEVSNQDVKTLTEAEEPTDMDSENDDYFSSFQPSQTQPSQFAQSFATSTQVSQLNIQDMVTKAMEKVQQENNKQLEEWKKMFIEQKNKIDKKGTDREAEEAKQRELTAIKEAAARKEA